MYNVVICRAPNAQLRWPTAVKNICFVYFNFNITYVFFYGDLQIILMLQKKVIAKIHQLLRAGCLSLGNKVNILFNPYVALQNSVLHCHPITVVANLSAVNFVMQRERVILGLHPHVITHTHTDTQNIRIQRILNYTVRPWSRPSI